MSAADSARARVFLCVYAALDFFTPVIVAGLLLLALAPLASDGEVPVLSSAVKRVFGLCLAGAITTAMTEKCASACEACVSSLRLFVVHDCPQELASKLVVIFWFGENFVHGVTPAEEHSDRFCPDA